MGKVICVYSSSSNRIGEAYFAVAAKLGHDIARRGDTLLFGGGMVGLMGATAKAAHRCAGKVIGVIPRALNQKGIVYETCDELIVTEGLRERKAVMDERSDAFVALPGGYGTLEEILEIITLKQLKYHNKPIIILNAFGFYDGLLSQFARMVRAEFARPASRALYHVADTAEDALAYLDAYRPQEIGDKWE